MSAELNRSWTYLSLEEAGDQPAPSSPPCESRLHALKILAVALLDVCALWWERYGHVMWPGKEGR